MTVREAGLGPGESHRGKEGSGTRGWRIKLGSRRGEIKQSPRRRGTTGRTLTQGRQEEENGTDFRRAAFKSRLEGKVRQGENSVEAQGSEKSSLVLIIGRRRGRACSQGGKIPALWGRRLTAEVVESERTEQGNWGPRGGRVAGEDGSNSVADSGFSNLRRLLTCGVGGRRNWEPREPPVAQQV